MKVKVVRGTTSRQVRRYIAAPSSTRAGASGGLFVGSNECATRTKVW